MTCDLRSVVATLRIYPKEFQGKGRSSDPCSLRRRHDAVSSGWPQHLGFSVPSRNGIPSAVTRTINFSQTRRGPWRPRASGMAPAEGPARPPEGLRGSSGAEGRSRDASGLCRARWCQPSARSPPLGFSAGSPGMAPPQAGGRRGPVSRGRSGRRARSGAGPGSDLALPSSSTFSWAWKRRGPQYPAAT